MRLRLHNPVQLSTLLVCISQFMGCAQSTEILGVLASSTTITHLAVADADNHRILVWNTFPTDNYQQADFVLGQFNFTNSSANIGSTTSIFGLSGPRGIATDGSLFYTADTGNNRVLVWKRLPTHTQQLPSWVMGQSSMNTAVTGTSATTLSSVNYVTTAGTSLIATDNSNNRVLIWNIIPTVNQTAPDLVLGQSNMTTSTTGISGSSLNNPMAVASDGKRLFLVDRGNHRVLIWNNFPTTTGKAADLVVGQPNMTTATTALNGTRGLFSPSGVFSDGTRLFVADSNNHRVLIWNTVPSSNFQAASVVLGQSSFSSVTANQGNSSPSSTSLSNPVSVASDGTRLVVSDLGNHRVMIWNSIPTSNNTAADIVLGQPDFESSAINNPNTTVGPSTLYSPYGITIW